MLNLALIEDKLAAGEVTTRWRKWRPMEADKEIGGGADKTGYTVAIGKRVSESYLRLYDKKKEQESKGETVELEHWVRCELETHKRRADALFQEFVCQVVAGTGPAFFAEYLNGLIQFREPGQDTNKSRWEVSTWWAEFIGTIEKVRITLPKPKNSIQKVMTWFEDNIAPMAAVIASHDGEWLLEKIREGSKRWSLRHMALLSACEFDPLPGNV